MVTLEKSARTAQEWIQSWNSHDLDSILSHYSDDVEFTSPFIVKLMGVQSGTIHGKARLREYFGVGLSAYPELKFELLRVLSGVNSFTLFYKSVKDMLAAEVMMLNDEGKISKVIAHYSQD